MKPVNTTPAKPATASSAHVRVNVDIPKETRVLWHTEALQREISLTELVRRAVAEYIAKPGTPQAR